MGTHPIFESDFDCLTETVTSRGLVCPVWQTEEIGRAKIPKIDH